MTVREKKTHRPKKLKPAEFSANYALQSAVVRGEPQHVIEALRAKLEAVRAGK